MADEARTNPEELTVDQLKEQLAQMKAENAKLGADAAKAKNRIDELCKNEGNLKKALREKQTAEEAAEAAKKEQEAAEKQRVSNLERELGIMKATNRYMGLGFGDQSETLATYEYDGDMDSWTDAVTKHLTGYKAQLEEAIRAEYAAKMPTPSSGNSSTVDYTKLIADAQASGDTLTVAKYIREQAEANGFKIHEH
jgi:chromosome segregation ATPase